MSGSTDVQKKRRSFRLLSWSGALVVTGIVIVLNYIAGYVPLRLDLSSGRAYSISRGSKDLLKKLDDTLVVKIVFSSQLPPVYKLNENYVGDLLSEYRRASHGRIRIEYLDPGSSPKAREEAINSAVGPVQLDVRERDRREVKECFMGVAFFYGDKKESIPVIQDTENLEYEISSRIRRLIDPTKPAVGLISNGGAIASTNKELETLAPTLRQLYDLEDVDLSKPLTKNFKSLWLIGPTKPLEPAELAALKTYLNSGGALGLMLNQNSIQLEAFRAMPILIDWTGLLDEWGLAIKRGLVVDPRCDRIQLQTIQGAFRMVNVVDYPFFPFVTDLNRRHPATQNLDGVAFPFVSAVETKEKKPNVKVTSLARSSEYSFNREQLFDMNPLHQHEALATDAKGPFDLALLAENGPARLILVGSSRFVESSYPLRPANYNLFINLIDWSVQDEALIQIRAKGFSRRPLKQMSDAARILIKYAAAFGLPILAVGLGLFVWRKQKTRRRFLPLDYTEA